MAANVISFRAKEVTPEDLMTVSEFAKKYGCTAQYLYKLRNIGKLKMFPRGYLKISEQEALEALEG